MLTSDAMLAVDAPSRSRPRSASGFEGASITEIFQTVSAGSSPARCISVTSSSSPVSAIRKLRMPHSAARATSSAA